MLAALFILVLDFEADDWMQLPVEWAESKLKLWHEVL